MNISILADESVAGPIIDDIANSEFDIESIVNINPGITDEEVLGLARTSNKILITEDKDFGEWVFAHKMTDVTIIFLRYDKADLNTIFRSVLSVLRKIKAHSKPTEKEFITINKNKVRFRKL